MDAPRTLRNQHAVNLAVLLVSALAAWAAPLQTFLVAYAVVGPFHYLTEIAWLRKKDFFFGGGVVSPPVYLWIAVGLGAMASLDLYFKRGWAVYAIGALLVLSLGALVRSVPALLGALGIVFALKFLLHGYGLFLAVFVPTVLHVYVFTLIFLVSGAMRSRPRTLLGWANPLLLLLLPLALVRAGGGLGVTAPGGYWMQSERMFAGVHDYLSGLLGLGMHFAPGAPLSSAAVATFRFLAFIYLHHYLNWFAKTELLEWHRMSRRSWVTVGVLYSGMLLAYGVNFALGFYVSYFVSLLHVLLELPLNWRGGAGVAAVPWGAVREWWTRQRAEVAP